MTRALPAGVAPPVLAPPSPTLSDTLVRITLRTVTPVFGGSAEPRRLDEAMPVRGAAVRGQLRFWWRACRAADFATSEQLFTNEAAIWGATSGNQVGPATIEVRVERLDPAPQRVRYDQWRSLPGEKDVFPRYAVFPFQEQTQTGVSGADALKDVRFRLALTLAPHARAMRQKQVCEMARREQRDRLSTVELEADWAAWRVTLQNAAEGAVWAWIAFGGIGSRTRRGCGTLLTNERDFQPTGEAESWLQQTWNEHVTPGERRLLIPSLGRARFFALPPANGNAASTPMDAWWAAVGAMQDFRQGEGVGRNPRNPVTRRPGRSYWPEPDSVRELQLHPDTRPPPIHTSKPYFPRADLGLPMLFQQMGSPTPTLEGGTKGWQRMASPVVLKALPFSDNAAVPLVVLLDAPHVWEGPGVQLRGSLKRPDPRGIPPPQLYTPGKVIGSRQPHLGKDTAREAFAAYLISRGWHEVRLP